MAFRAAQQSISHSFNVNVRVVYDDDPQYYVMCVCVYVCSIIMCPQTRRMHNTCERFVTGKDSTTKTTTAQQLTQISPVARVYKYISNRTSAVDLTLYYARLLPIGNRMQTDGDSNRSNQEKNLLVVAADRASVGEATLYNWHISCSLNRITGYCNEL